MATKKSKAQWPPPKGTSAHAMYQQYSKYTCKFLKKSAGLTSDDGKKCFLENAAFDIEHLTNLGKTLKDPKSKIEAEQWLTFLH